MLTVNIIAIGRLKEEYLRRGVEEYSKRLAAFCKFNIIELDEYRLPDNPSLSQIAACINAEGEKISAKIPNGAYVFSMCIEGRQMPSESLAERIKSISLQGKSCICFIIGGSYGLAEAVKQKSDFKLSMSEMTFPHQLARLMMSEQIYRAFSINANTKYHK